jgi:hypothetical protein
VKKDGRSRCAKCSRPLTDPVSIALGMGPICRGDSAKRKASPTPRTAARRGRAYSDPLYVNTTLFTVVAEPDDNEKKRRRTLLASHLPFPCGDVTFYPLDGGGWQSSGGSRTFTDEELSNALIEAGMI